MSAKLSDGAHTLDVGPVALDRALRQLYAEVSWNTARAAITSGKVSVDDVVVRDPAHQVTAGDTIRVRMNAAKHARVALADDAIVHLDGHLVVVNKPPGLASVPADDWRRGTLSQLVAARVKRRRDRAVPLGVVQRLDVETSGLIVFTRSKEAHAKLKEQFKKREVERDYLALAAGEVANATFRSYLTEHKNGKRSSTRHKHLGKYACTHVTALEQLAGATLVRCKLETGRTHQIRIHLSEAGHPLLGDKRYARRQVDTPPAPRVMLHAATLGFVHPISGQRLRFEAAMPDDMAAVRMALKA